MILQAAMAQGSRFGISVGLFRSSQSKECFPAFCIDQHVLVTHAHTQKKAKNSSNTCDPDHISKATERLGPHN